MLDDIVTALVVLFRFVPVLVTETCGDEYLP